MPHVVIKLWPGRAESVKQELVKRIQNEMMDVLKVGEDAVSIAIEEIAKEDWGREVYKKDIVDKPDTLYKKPGYEYAEWKTK